MKNKKIILGILLAPLIGVSIAWADFDCSTLDQEEIKTIMDKKMNKTELTSDEETLLESAESCRPDFSWSGNMMRERFWSGSMNFGSGMTQRENFWSGKTQPNFWSGIKLTDEQKTAMEEVKTIMEKQKNWETLTTEEKTKLDNYKTNFQDKKTTKTNTNTQTKLTSSNSNLNNAYKNSINAKISALTNKFDNKNDKLSYLKNFSTKVTKMQTTISNLNITDERKETYQSIISYLLEKINQNITELEATTEDIDSLLDELLTQ